MRIKLYSDRCSLLYEIYFVVIINSYYSDVRDSTELSSLAWKVIEDKLTSGEIKEKLSNLLKDKKDQINLMQDAQVEFLVKSLGSIYMVRENKKYIEDAYEKYEKFLKESKEVDEILTTTLKNEVASCVEFLNKEADKLGNTDISNYNDSNLILFCDQVNNLFYKNPQCVNQFLGSLTSEDRIKKIASNQLLKSKKVFLKEIKKIKASVITHRVLDNINELKNKNFGEGLDKDKTENFIANIINESLREPKEIHIQTIERLSIIEETVREKLEGESNLKKILLKNNRNVFVNKFPQCIAPNKIDEEQHVFYMIQEILNKLSSSSDEKENQKCWKEKIKKKPSPEGRRIKL